MQWFSELNWLALLFLAPVPFVVRAVSLVEEVARITDRKRR
ncbi:hypothetical protein BXY66_1134 [Shimia isoporae]|uniref:Uncharacterized protein n=1 Tax=Shimia isoporae TaxID=647720 RepID=A0A4R1NMV7_9RHOB|nr:hypothetical protein [Shimia isoporae]TCL09091.1 hypothetical protein BXY66_1134 [Shimia isoporae]